MKEQAYNKRNLKNGWDLPPGVQPPLTGRKQEWVRAYELLIKKEDADYIREAKEAQTRAAEAQKQQAGEQAAEAVKKQTAPPSDRAADAAADTDAHQKEWEEELRPVPAAQRQKQRRKKRRIAAAVIAAAVLLTGGRIFLGPPILTANISAYADIGIEIEGLTDEPFTVTPRQLRHMRLDALRVAVHKEELAPDEVPELGRAIGPTVETFLKEYGSDITQIRSMKVYTENGHSTAYVHSLKDGKIILSVANGRRPLGEKEAPLRIAAEGAGADEWSGWIRRIVFTEEPK